MSNRRRPHKSRIDRLVMKSDDALSRMFREKCECGGPVKWGGIGDVMDNLGPDALNELLDTIPGDLVDSESMGSAFFWFCGAYPSCGALGVFLDPPEGLMHG